MKKFSYISFARWMKDFSSTKGGSMFRVFVYQDGERPMAYVSAQQGDVESFLKDAAADKICLLHQGTIDKKDLPPAIEALLLLEKQLDAGTEVVEAALATAFLAGYMAASR